MHALVKITLVGLALVAAAGGASAQALVEKKSLSLEGAKRVAAAAEAEARKLKVGGAIAVVDDGGNLMYLLRIDKTPAAGASISIGKARTAVLFQRPTSFFETVIGNGRTAMTALSDFTPLQGGVPIVVDGQVVGGIGVSGAASAKQDEELALVGAGALVAGAPRDEDRTPIVYLERDVVAAAFAKGAPLVENDVFKVHASRRDAPGQAEVHRRDTDIIYVLDGSATFVTGGTVVNGRALVEDEIRGEAIQGGEARRIGKGDVIIVPAGTPHWFKEVLSPLTYYVVKAH